MTPEESAEKKREYNRAYYAANHAKIIEKRKECSEKRNERRRAHHAADNDRINEQRRTQYAANPSYVDKQRARCRLWDAANADKVRDRKAVAARARYAVKGEFIREKSRLWYDSNRAKSCEYSSKYRAEHPEQVRINARAGSSKRRALKMTFVKEAPTGKQLATVLLDPCIYCGAPAEHIDHCIPLSRGGEHNLENLVPSCAPCNMSKGSKLPGIEWKGRKSSGEK